MYKVILISTHVDLWLPDLILLKLKRAISVIKCNVKLIIARWLCGGSSDYQWHEFNLSEDFERHVQSSLADTWKLERGRNYQGVGAQPLEKFCTPIKKSKVGQFNSKLKQFGGRGRGVFDLAKVKIEFLLFLTEESVSYQMLFIGSKNIVPSRSYTILKSGKYG